MDRLSGESSSRAQRLPTPTLNTAPATPPRATGAVLRGGPLKKAARVADLHGMTWAWPHWPGRGRAHVRIATSRCTSCRGTLLPRSRPLPDAYTAPFLVTKSGGRARECRAYPAQNRAHTPTRGMPRRLRNHTAAASKASRASSQWQRGVGGPSVAPTVGAGSRWVPFSTGS